MANDKKHVMNDALESMLITLKGYIDQLSARVDALEGDIDQLSARVDALERSIIPDDLAGTTWVLNSTLDLPEYGTSYNIDFNVQGLSQDFVELLVSKYSEPPTYFDAPALAIWTEEGGGAGIYLYDDVSHWYVPEQRHISITGGADATDPDLIKWLFYNAVQIKEENNEDQLEA